jgi:IS30 family transposase
MNTYQQLTYEQRCQISVLNKSKSSQRKIAVLVGVSQSTISRELNRNMGDRGYRHKQAQSLCKNRRKDACKVSKMTKEMISIVENKLRIEWSPKQVSGWLLDEKSVLLSHETIYLHIWKDKRSGGDLYTYLRRQGKKYDKRRNGKSTRGQIKNRISIDDRPKVVDEIARIGDREIDTVIGKGHSGAIVTIVERVIKFTLAKQVNGKTAEEVTQATIDLLGPYKDIVHTITADNGKEFAYHERISEVLETDVYFAHPYSSWERGLNENTNGLLRQYFPKSTNLKNTTQKEVRHAVDRLNARPRETLFFKTPGDLIKAHMAA